MNYPSVGSEKIVEKAEFFRRRNRIFTIDSYTRIMAYIGRCVFVCMWVLAAVCIIFLCALAITQIIISVRDFSYSRDF